MRIVLIASFGLFASLVASAECVTREPSYKRYCAKMKQEALCNHYSDTVWKCFWLKPSIQSVDFGYANGIRGNAEFIIEQLQDGGFSSESATKK